MNEFTMDDVKELIFKVQMSTYNSEKQYVSYIKQLEGKVKELEDKIKQSEEHEVRQG